MSPAPVSGDTREGGRRAARRQAVVLLYQREVTGMAIEELERNADRAGVPIDPFARALVEGVSVDTTSLDGLIDAAAVGWSAARMAPLERSILRVAIHELLDWPDIPAAVSINEAVELAKRFCQAEAGGLVNGILARVAKEQESGAAPDDTAAASDGADGGEAP